MGHDIFFKGRLIEPVLGGPRVCFVAAVLKSSTWIPCPSVLAHGTRLWFDTRRSLRSGPGPDASKQLAARDGYLSAVSQLKSVPAHAGRRCIPLSLGMSPPLMIVVQLPSWLVICVARVTCDFVSRLGGRDTIFFQFLFQRTAD